MIKLNCLAKDLENAREILKATNNNALIGILTKNFENFDECVKTIKLWSKELNGSVSIGLGGGDPKQAYMVTQISGLVNVDHINQVFPEVPATRNNTKNKNAIINSLISPSGTPGKVIISTGPLSCKAEKIIGNINTVSLMVKEMGGNALKFFNMKNMLTDDELFEVAKSCAKNNLILEITGGISLSNIQRYLTIAKKANVKKVIPHIYGSIIDPISGETNLHKIRQLWKIFREFY